MADVTATIARCGYGPSCAMTRRKRDPGKSFTLRTVPIVIPARDTVTLSHKLQQDPYLLASAYTLFPAACERS